MFLRETNKIFLGIGYGVRKRGRESSQRAKRKMKTLQEEECGEMRRLASHLHFKMSIRQPGREVKG